MKECSYNSLNLSDSMTTRSQLIKRLHIKHQHLTWNDCDLAVRVILEAIGNQLAVHGRAEIRNFGAFTVRIRPAKQGRNPKNGTAVDVPAKTVPHFKPGRELSACVDPRLEMKKKSKRKPALSATDREMLSLLKSL